MKMEPDVTMASQDAVFLITKAIELFIESLAMESYTYTANQKKKTVSRQDVEKAIDAVDALAFLDGAMDDQKTLSPSDNFFFCAFSEIIHLEKTTTRYFTDFMLINLKKKNKIVKV